MNKHVNYALLCSLGLSLAFPSLVFASINDEFNDVSGVPFIKGKVIICKKEDFKPTEFNGNTSYSVCRLPLTDNTLKATSPMVVTKYPAVVHSCFNQKEYGGIPLLNNDKGRYSDYNRSINYAGNCAVIIRVNYQHGGKCYAHFANDYFEVYQSNHLLKITESGPHKEQQFEMVPCTMHDVPVIFDYKDK